MLCAEGRKKPRDLGEKSPKNRAQERPWAGGQGPAASSQEAGTPCSEKLRHDDNDNNLHSHLIPQTYSETSHAVYFFFGCLLPKSI
eukprot:scaffold5586_cov124-Isochrysis_galbana.AAC.8